MTTRKRRLGVAVMLALLALAAPGCTNSDPLSAHPGQLTTSVNVVPAGAAGFDTFILTLQQIGIESLSATADTNVGSSYGAMRTALGLNLGVTGARTAGVADLSVGTYQVNRVSFKYRASGLFFSSNPVRPVEACNPANCLDYVMYRTGTPVDPENPDGERVNGKLPPSEWPLGESEIPITGIAASPAFPVPDNGAAAITVNFNGAEMALLFRNAFRCQCNGQCTQVFPAIQAPCVFQFIPPSLEELASHVSVSVQ